MHNYYPRKNHSEGKMDDLTIANPVSNISLQERKYRVPAGVSQMIPASINGTRPITGGLQTIHFTQGTDKIYRDGD